MILSYIHSTVQLKGVPARAHKRLQEPLEANGVYSG